MENLFETASRLKYRFPSTRGSVSSEDLWDLKLTELNNVAKNIHASIVQEESESFIDDATPATKTLRQQLDVVKHVIAYKKAKAQAEAVRKENRQKLETLRNILEQKKVEQLQGLSTEELELKLQELQSLV